MIKKEEEEGKEEGKEGRKVGRKEGREGGREEIAVRVVFSVKVTDSFLGQSVWGYTQLYVPP